MTYIGNERGGIVKILLWAIVIGALYAGYYYFQDTPRYALMQFKRGILFKNQEIVEEFLDIDNFIAEMQEETSHGVNKEQIRKRIIHDINWPTEYTMFVPVEDWSVIRVPIDTGDIADGVATVEPDEGTHVRIERVGERRWMITSIKFKKPPEKIKKVE